MIPGRLRAALRRRERVVPVVPASRRRRWERAAPDDWAAALHLYYLRHRDEYQPAYFAKFRAYPYPRNRLARAWRWYVSDVLVQAARLARINGRAVRAAAGVPVRRQLWEMLRLAVSLPSMPENYYKFELYRPANRARADQFLHRHETKGGLYLMLAGGADLEAVAPVNDKPAFAARAQAAALPVVPTLARLAPGGQVEQFAPLPAADLFVKLAAGKGGRGAQKWRYLADQDRYHRLGDGAEVARDQFLSWLAAHTPDASLIVQPNLVNHPDLADLALDAVATCRIITILDESGVPEPVIAIFRMPATRGAIVDNLHRGGVAAPVDITTGMLGPASGYATEGVVTRHRHHPVSGAQIDGRKLPLWEQVRQLACQAHTAFQPRVLVGWDIGIGPDGPVLIEGNEQPGVDGLQRLHNQPLGSHRFGQLLAHHLRARFG
ncbi:MAG TPA: sugar-transfer associated ATP-grasp domain-containing protein [Natronosporangium sp.]|nr:sugar-transfer associated ATP-grasp domain-containing protein [Natronosporangium sp.]